MDRPAEDVKVRPRKGVPVGRMGASLIIYWKDQEKERVAEKEKENYKRCGEGAFRVDLT